MASPTPTPTTELIIIQQQRNPHGTQWTKFQLAKAILDLYRMGLITEYVGEEEKGPPRFRPVEGTGEGAAPLPAVAALDYSVYQDMQNCIKCGGLQIFVPVYECEAGRVGYCLGCGEERIVLFSRTNSEAA
jgi:hypothetical protein